jgi:xanthine dehydrogenase accessory factor
MENLYEKLIDLQRRGIPLMMVTVIEKTGEGPVEVGKKMIVGENLEAYGTVGGGALEFYARELCKELLLKRENRYEKYLLAEGKVYPDTITLPMACGGKVSLMYEYLGAKEYVYIFGAGHVGQALANVLKTMPFHITVIDERKEVAKAFKNADLVYDMGFVEYIEKYSIKEDSFVVVCTPAHLHDYHVINKILELKLKPKYMGMLCSPIKLRDYLDKTYEQFGQEVDLSNFYSPIGLNLGGGSPSEIAISISSEILAVSNGKINHNHMRETTDGVPHYW